VRDDERALLAPWMDGFARAFGAPPGVEALPPSAGPPPGRFRLVFPPVFDPPEMLGGTGHFRGSDEVAAHMRRLGFAWEGAGRILGAPTPSSFNASLAALDGPDAGYRLLLTVEDRPALSGGPWLCRYMDGLIPLHVCTAAFYAAHGVAPAADARDHASLAWHFTTLAHDLTVHAQNYHRVPRACIDALGARIRAAFPAAWPAWDRPGAAAPMTLASFYDNDLNRYCYAVWSRCRRAADFGPAFAAPAHLAQLYGALDVRIAETRAGKGDVPDGRAEEMAPLAPVEFRIG
jgi:hypothetical protein